MKAESFSREFSVLAVRNARNSKRAAWVKCTIFKCQAVGMYVRDDKVRELATVFLPWQHWTKALVWLDDVDISGFHSCVVVDVWHSLSEWHLLVSACVLVCRRENVGAWITATNIKFQCHYSCHRAVVTVCKIGISSIVNNNGPFIYIKILPEMWISLLLLILLHKHRLNFWTIIFCLSLYLNIIIIILLLLILLLIIILEVLYHCNRTVWRSNLLRL